MNSEDASALRDDELRKIREELASVNACYRATVARNLSLEGQVLATEELLHQAQEKVRSMKQKRIEADHYRSLLHELRSHWYLRPFIPGGKLKVPKDDFHDRWHYRGPRFDLPSSVSGSEYRRHRVLVVGHLLSVMLFGSENSLLDTISAIDPDRFDIFAVFPEHNEPVFARLQPYVQGIAVLDYTWWRFGRPVREETVAAFETLLRQQAIDLVHVNTIMIQDALIAARRLGIPSITNARELISLDEELATRLGGTPAEIVRAVCENATYILANSATTLADYPCGDRGGFLYNSIDERSFDLPNPVDPNCIKVGMISSNIRKKGVLDFFELARLAENDLPALQFHLIGPQSSLVREWQSGLEGFARNLRVRDYVSPPAAAYEDLNIVLNLSRFAESFGRTVAEAMAARRPVIAYRHGALPELIVDGQTGFLVPYLDLAAVLECLRFFARQPEEIARFGEAARLRIMQRCSPQVFGQGLGAIYENLIACKGTHS